MCFNSNDTEYYKDPNEIAKLLPAGSTVVVVEDENGLLIFSARFLRKNFVPEKDEIRTNKAGAKRLYPGKKVFEISSSVSL